MMRGSTSISLVRVLSCASSIALMTVAGRAQSDDARGDDVHPRRPAELFVVLGGGNAVCDQSKPSNQCVVDGGLALGIGGAWRLHPHWAIGGELAYWGYKTRDEWRGTLTDPATDVKFSSFYLAPFGRWYWFGHGVTDAYLQAGIGYGAFNGKASNDSGSYQIAVRGIVFPVAIGAEWLVSTRLRLGVQALAYLQKSRTVCETTNGNESCRDATSDQNALPWRLVAVATVLLGDP